MSTISIYSGAGDGTSYFSFTTGTSQATWDDAHDQTAGNGASYTGSTDARVGAYWRSAGQASYIFRGFLPFDTSGIGAGNTLTDAVLYIYPQSINDSLNDAKSYIAVVQTTQASTSEITTADYDQCGAINNPTKGSGDYDISSATTSAYSALTLNATGIGWINTSGWTKLGLREGHDLEDSFPSLTPSKYEEMQCYSSEDTGTARDPYLYITYTAAGGSTFIPQIIMY